MSNVQIPGMSVFSLRSAIDEMGLDIPLILITGLAEDEVDDSQAIVMSKPYNIRKLKKSSTALFHKF